MDAKGRIYIRTLGCPKNEADSAALVRHLERAGWVVVDDVDSAEAEIINTCGFVETTKLESLEAIWAGVSRKERAGSETRKLIVTGCLAQRYPSQIVTQIPSLDAVVGFNRPDLVEQALATPASSGAPACWVEKPGTVYRDDSTAWAFDNDHPAPLSAYIKIGDGCDNACRFCAIPLIRGSLRSRSQKSILAEIETLVEHGTREIILVSQDTTSWGADCADGSELSGLLREINAISGNFWIRVMYAHPAFLTLRQIVAFGDCEKIVPYLDMPMQHISDRMLRIMNRHTTRAQTQSTIDRLRRVRPDLALRTTFIVGHPGETKADFAELLSFAEDNAFERMGGFVYSAEDGTPAGRMKGQIPKTVARERLSRLTEAFDRWSADQSVDKIGRSIPCLLERSDKDGTWEGRTVHDAPEIDGRVTIASGMIDCPGLYDVTITAAYGVDLEGDVGNKPTATPIRPQAMAWEVA
ncbi:MAG: 30S ribosomal protein S12 methylthiotransferase RimO [candidate division Zixibacteria bacterium]|nr:30S ribosomal protein S12 methylthiotransferase RimO [candidate division Zixibacteria bacterium]